MGGGRFEGVIPFVLLFLLLFFIHSKLYDMLSRLYGKAKRAYRKMFPAKPVTVSPQEPKK
ncbi:MAG: hypothetical protein B6245_11955 [Desulfobacteraceae bacterium 4572_88]|nr:MAG: hypothetical protein B6245_11955 [Desulfobacteraceae bacterium 4572_88]